MEQESSKELVVEMKDKEWRYRDTEEFNKAIWFCMTSSSFHIAWVLFHKAAWPMHSQDSGSYLSLCCSYEQNLLLFGYKARNKHGLFEFDAISKAKACHLHEQKPYLPPKSIETMVSCTLAGLYTAFAFSWLRLHLNSKQAVTLRALKKSLWHHSKKWGLEYLGNNHKTSLGLHEFKFDQLEQKARSECIDSL